MVDLEKKKLTRTKAHDTCIFIHIQVTAKFSLSNMFLCLNIGIRSRYHLSQFESGITLSSQCSDFFSNAVSIFCVFLLSVLRFFDQGVEWHFLKGAGIAGIFF